MNIESILSSDAHWNVNKKLTKKVGIVPAVLLMELVFCRKKYGGPEFFESSEKLEMALGIGRELRKSAIKTLVESGFLIAQKKGIPARYWFQICDEKIAAFLLSDTASDTSSEAESRTTSDTAPRSTINKNINKNINNIQHSNQEETLKNLEKSFTLNKQQHLLRRDGSADAETDQELTLEIQENAPRIDVEKSLGAEVSKGSRDASKASKNGSKAKITKSVIQAFYEYYKKLNDSFEQHTTWDARETKTLRDELLKAALPVDRLLEWKPDWVNKSNPYYKVLEPAWRLLADRNKKKSDFYKKIFRPSTFTVKYIECLSELNCYDDAITQKEDPELDNDLLMLNEKLKGEIK